MEKTTEIAIHWLKSAQEQDYAAAESYLTLLYTEKRVANLVAALHCAPVEYFRAVDVFRASGHAVQKDQAQVAREIDSVRQGRALSPLLLIRDTEHGRLVVAEGFQRLCAAYALDQDALIAAQII